MEKINNSVGIWRSHVIIDCKTPQLHIHGNVNTDQEKPIFKLVKSVPQGFNPLILLLDLINSDLIDVKGKHEQEIFQSIPIDSPNSYTDIAIKDVARFKVSDNFGTWKAIVKTGNKTSFLKVEGDFPTNGEEPRYSLKKANPQGIIHKQLILLLHFGNLADQEGAVNQHVEYNSDILIKEDEYTSIMVIDEGGRVIARQLIEFI